MTACKAREADDPRNRLPRLNLSLLRVEGGQVRPASIFAASPNRKILLALLIGGLAEKDAAPHVPCRLSAHWQLRDLRIKPYNDDNDNGVSNAKD